MSTEANANIESRNADDRKDDSKNNLKIRRGGVTRQDTLVVQPDPNTFKRI